MILADENIDAAIISYLRDNEIEVYSIAEKNSGISDEEVIAVSKKPPRIILTEDKDFGEWVYSHQEKEISVILLRYRPKDTKVIINILIDLVIKKRGELFGKFTIITTEKIRIRSLK